MELKEQLSLELDEYDMYTILINRAKYLYMLNLVFDDYLTNEIIDEYRKQGKLKEINTLDDCNTYIKASTIYLGLIKRLKNLIV